MKKKTQNSKLAGRNLKITNSRKLRKLKIGERTLKAQKILSLEFTFN